MRIEKDGRCADSFPALQRAGTSPPLACAAFTTPAHWVPGSGPRASRGSIKTGDEGLVLAGVSSEGGMRARAWCFPVGANHAPPQWPSIPSINAHA